MSLRSRLLIALSTTLLGSTAASAGLVTVKDDVEAVEYTVISGEIDRIHGSAGELAAALCRAVQTPVTT